MAKATPADNSGNTEVVPDPVVRTVDIAPSPDISAAEAAFDAESNIQEEVPTMKELQGVKYVGTADFKFLETEDLAALGFGEDLEALAWTPDNGHFVEAKRISAQMRDWFATQEDFVVV